MKKTITSYMKKAKQDEQEAIIREMFPDVEEADLDSTMQEYVDTCDILKSLMTSHTRKTPSNFGILNSEGKEIFPMAHERGETPLLSLKEATLSNDFSLFFKRVISDILLEPTETPYIGQDILARKVTVDGVRSVTFPVLSALVAGEISENGEYPQQTLAVNTNALELRVRKYGIAVNIGNDIIEDAMWDIFGLHVTAARNAMKRKKEELIFEQALAVGKPIFDNLTGNSGLAAEGNTTGIDQFGNPNGSLTMFDLLDACGGLIANGYDPTDIVLHPLCWIMLAKDPRLLFHSLMGNSYGQTMPTPGIDAGAIQKYLPFGMINVVVTPQMPFTPKQSLTMNLPPSGNVIMPATNVSNLLILDRKQSIIILQRDEMHMQEYEHKDRDVHIMRAGERYGVGVLDEGRSIVSINNVRLVQNFNPVYAISLSPPPV